MALKFNKRVKIAPGVKLNVGLGGVSTTIGAKGASVNVGKKGVYANTGLPGTGISARTKISGPSGSNEGGKKPVVILGIFLTIAIVLLLIGWLV